MFSRTVVINGLAAGTALVMAGAGAANAVGANKQISVTRVHHSAVALASNPTAPKGALGNLRVEVPMVPTRHALHALCEEFVLNHLVAQGRANAESFSELGVLIRATGGTVDGSRSWCRTFLRQDNPVHLAHRNGVRSIRQYKALVRTRPITLPMSSDATLPASDFGVVVSYSDKR